VVLAFLILAVSGFAGCAKSGPSAQERAVCARSQRLLTAKDRAEIRQIVADMADGAARAKNAKLAAAVENYKQALDAKDVAKATTALNDLSAACEAAGIPSN